MVGGEAPQRTRRSTWLILILALIPLAGCAGRTMPEYPSLLNQTRLHTPNDGDGSALRLARATRQAGDLGTAIQIYRTVVARKSVTPDVLVEFGDVQLEAGFPDDAIDTYSKVGPASPARLGALLGLMRADINLGQPAEALVYANAAQAMAPQEARVQIDRGVIFDSLGRHAEAQACYRGVLQVMPRDVPARNNLALSLALVNRYDEAIALMAPLVRSSSATAKERENMALIYGLMGDPAQASMLSRVDLDEGTTQANLAFMDAVRERKP